MPFHSLAGVGEVKESCSGFGTGSLSVLWWFAVESESMEQLGLLAPRVRLHGSFPQQQSWFKEFLAVWSPPCLENWISSYCSDPVYSMAS